MDRQAGVTVDARVELALLLLLGFLWGIPYALTKISLVSIPPITLVAARVLLAAVVLWIVALALKRPLPVHWTFLGPLCLQALFACLIPYTLIAYGQKSVDSALAAILNSSTPIFVCFISFAWTRHETLTPSRLAGATIGMAGVVLIAGTNALGGFGREMIGQSAILLATLSSAISVIYGRRFADVAPEVAAAGMLSVAAVILVPVSFVIETPWNADPSATSLFALLINGFVATALGFVIYFRLIRTIGSMNTASVGYLKPGIGVLIGWALLGEALNWTLAFGLFAILIGVAAVNQTISLRLVRRTRFAEAIRRPLARSH